MLKKASIVSEFISVLVSNFVPLMTTDKKTSSVIINCFDSLNARQNQVILFLTLDVTQISLTIYISYFFFLFVNLVELIIDCRNYMKSS